MNHGGQKWENKNRIEEKRKVYCAETDSRMKWKIYLPSAYFFNNSSY